MPVRPRERSDGNVLHPRGDGGDRFGVAGRGRGEARLDNVYSEAFEPVRHFAFFLNVHRAAGSLLPVAQRRVKYPYPSHSNLK